MIYCRKIFSYLGILFLVVTCSPEIYPPIAPDAGVPEIRQTFGQLITTSSKISNYMILRLPSGEKVRALSNGVVTYRRNFNSIGNCLILKPRGSASPTTDYSGLEAMPAAAALSIVFGNLDETSVRNAMITRYQQIGLSEAEAQNAAQRFVNGDPGNEEINVEVTENPFQATKLGEAIDQDVYLMAFIGKPDQIDSYANPLPYLKAGYEAFGSGAIAALDNQAPQIRRVIFRTSEDPLMTNVTTYEIPLSNELHIPNILFKNLSIQLEIEDHASASGPPIAIYELSYEVNKVVRDAASAITSRVLVSSGRNLFNEIPNISPDADEYFDVSETIFYKLNFDSQDSGPNNSFRQVTAVADITSWSNAEYEFVLKTRDVFMSTGTYVERKIYAHVNNSRNAIDAAKWSLHASVGVASAQIDNNSGYGRIHLEPGQSTFALSASLNNPPALSGNQAYRYLLKHNGANMPLANNTFLGGPNSLSIANTGIHELIVWLDENGNSIKEDSEASRRMIILNGLNTDITIAAMSGRDGATFVPLARDTKTALGESFKFAALVNSGPAYSAFWKYKWKVRNNGEVRNYENELIEPGVLLAGISQVELIGELYGVEFKAPDWNQSVVGVSISDITALWVNKSQSLSITSIPDGLTDLFNVRIISPSTACTFSDGTTQKSTDLPVTLDLLASAPSNEANDVSIEVEFNGVKVGEQKITIKGLEVVDGNETQATTLFIARWDKAYEYDSRGYPVVLNTRDPERNLVDMDPRRFYLIINDKTKAGSNFITIPGIGTNSDADSDDRTSLSLRETGLSSGIFRSESHFLVSPDLIGAEADDMLSVYSAQLDRPIPDDTPNDRSHRTNVDGTVHITYEGSAPQPHSVPVCGDQRRVVKIRQTIFNEPFLDDGIDQTPGTNDTGENDGKFSYNDNNGDGIHNDEEECEMFLDISNGKNVYDETGSWGPIVKPEVAQHQLERAQVGWAQACIKVAQVGDVYFSDAPTKLVDGKRVNILSDGVLNLLDEEEPLVHQLIKERGTFPDVIEVLYLPIPTEWALARSPSRSQTIANSENDFASRWATNNDLAFVYINTYGDPKERKVLAHEIAHILDNKLGDHPSTREFFYPTKALDVDWDVTLMRRIPEATELDCRTMRDAGNYSQPGNIILE